MNTSREQMIDLSQQQNKRSSMSGGGPELTKDGQLSTSTLALRELNKSLPSDRQIKLMLFLYSKFSTKSDMLIKALPQECRQFFYYICIDNVSIREKIMKSSTIKISEVPCILVVDINDTISTYEGDRSVDIIKTIHALNNKHQLSTHGSNCQCPVHQKMSQQQQDESSPSSVTQLTDILDESEESGEENPYPSESKRPPRVSPIPERMPVPRDDEDMSTLIDDDDSQTSSVRTKVRHANRPPDNHIPEQQRPDVGLSSARNFPTKGLGHEGMANSSLKQIPSYPKQRREAPMQVSGGEMLDDELDDMLNEDLTMDPQIRNMNSNKSGGGSIDRGEQMKNVKMAAAEMAKMREAEAEDN